MYSDENPTNLLIIIGCESKEDGFGLIEAIKLRFAQFGLTIHPEKSSVIRFSNPGRDKEPGNGKDTFDFLGFTHYWAKSLQGYWVIKRKTSRKRVKRTMKEYGYGVGSIAMNQSRNSTRQSAKSYVVIFNTMPLDAIIRHWKKSWTSYKEPGDTDLIVEEVSRLPGKSSTTYLKPSHYLNQKSSTISKTANRVAKLCAGVVSFSPVTEEPYELVAHVRDCGGTGWVTSGSTQNTDPLTLSGYFFVRRRDQYEHLR